MKLSIIIPCTDTKGAFVTLQSLLLHHQDIIKLSEILVVGNKTTHKWLVDYIEHFSNVRFMDFSEKHTISSLINIAISMASHEHILCVQPNCLIESGAIGKLLEFYNFNYDSFDLFQGPLTQGSQKLLQVKQLQIRNMLKVVTDKVVRGMPFAIQFQDLGVFSCRRNAWPGINELFKIFDGSGYIHDKFRMRGNECLCLPWFNWSRPIVEAASSTSDCAHDITIWCSEVNRDPRKIFDQIDIEYPEAVSIFKKYRSKYKLSPQIHSTVAHGHKHFISCVTIAGDASDNALNECVESFRRQTYPRRELIIINDTSNRQINIDTPLVKVVNISHLNSNDILKITGGDFICFWPADKISYPTKLSVMMTNLVDDCSWCDECFDVDVGSQSPTVLFTRSLLISTINDVNTVGDITTKFTQPHTKLQIIQDIGGDTTHVYDKGNKSYRLIPYWSNRVYEKISTSYGAMHQKIKSITAFLLMRNLVEWPLVIINKLKKLNINTVLVDQGSTYPPLLDYYEKCDLDIYKLSGPICRFEFINSDIPLKFCNKDDFYLVLDNNININDLPDNIVNIMANAIYDYGGPAAGIDIKRNKHKTTFHNHHWDKPGNKALFPFAMYRMGSKINNVPQKCMYDHTVRYMPYELDIENGISDELLYHIKQRIVSDHMANPKLIDEYLALINKPSDDSQYDLS